MIRYCKNKNHIWTVETVNNILCPMLDLIPGRRCLCGKMVLLHNDSKPPREGLLLVASIDSRAGKKFGDANPALKTW